MNWIRQEKRLAIYLRDGLACVYCGATAEGGTVLSLDHVKPHVRGGCNSETNLVTCCERCNSSRGARPLAKWVAVVAEYVNHGVTAEMIAADVKRLTRTKLAPFKAQALELISQRGSAAKVLAAMR